jgi:Protein of unknown function, DUF481
MDLKSTLRSGGQLRLALLIAILFTTPLFARTKTDVIVMRNGDRFTGEIKGLDAGVLYVGLDYMLGTVSIQWSKVDHVESQQLFLVKAEDGSVYSGTLKSTETAEGRPIKLEILEAPEKSIAVEQTKVIQLTQTSDKFWQRFNGKLNSGFSYTKGNQSTQYSLGTDIEYPRERWAASATFNSVLASSQGSTTTTRNDLSLDALRFLRWNNWFYSGIGNFLQSSTQNIDVQTNISGGVGRYLKNTNRAQVSVIGGMAWQNTKYSQSTTPQTSLNVAAAMVGTHVEFFRFKKTNLVVDAFAFPAVSQPGRVNLNVNATYYLKIFGEIDWNISFYGNWDNQPPMNFSGSDYGTSSGLTYTWGNK